MTTVVRSLAVVNRCRSWAMEIRLRNRHMIWASRSSVGRGLPTRASAGTGVSETVAGRWLMMIVRAESFYRYDDGWRAAEVRSVESPTSER